MQLENNDYEIINNNINTETLTNLTNALTKCTEQVNKLTELLNKQESDKNNINNKLTELLSKQVSDNRNYTYNNLHLDFIYHCKNNDLNLLTQLFDEYQEEIKLIINKTDLDGKPGLCYAVTNKNAVMVELLLKNGADPNISMDINYTILMHACEYDNNEKIIKLLLNNGAHINTQNETQGRTALMIASENTNPATIELLMEYDARYNIQDYLGNTALMWAVNCKKNIEIIKTLLKYKLDINHRNCKGYTALSFAFEQNNKEYVELLLKYGADPYIEFDKNGQYTLYDLVTDDGIKQVIDKFYKTKKMEEEIEKLKQQLQKLKNNE